MGATQALIETDHLRLVPFAPDQLLALIEQPERFEELAGFPAAVGLREFFVGGEVSPSFLASLRTHRQPDPWRFGFLVVHLKTGTGIGSGGFKSAPDSAGVTELAYGIVPGFEGRGYATEVANALVAWAFGTGSVQRVVAHTLPTPNASTRVLKKCKFEFAGEFVDPDDGPVWRWERTAARS